MRSILLMLVVAITASCKSRADSSQTKAMSESYPVPPFIEHLIIEEIAVNPEDASDPANQGLSLNTAKFRQIRQVKCATGGDADIAKRLIYGPQEFPSAQCDENINAGPVRAYFQIRANLVKVYQQTPELKSAYS